MNFSSYFYPSIPRTQRFSNAKTNTFEQCGPDTNSRVKYVAYKTALGRHNFPPKLPSPPDYGYTLPALAPLDRPKSGTSHSQQGLRPFTVLLDE